MTTRRSREEQRDATRTRILDAALRLFAERGFRATSTKRIANEAGVSEGLIFHHFPKKRDLIAGTRRGSRLSTRIVQRLAEADDVPVADAMREIAQGFVQMGGGDNAEARLFQIMIGESRTDPELGALFSQVNGRVVSSIADYLRVRIEAGEVRSDLACEAAAISFVGSLVWFFVTAPSGAPDDLRASAMTYADQVLDQWLRGVLATP